MGIRDEKKYATPLKPESKSERLWDNPTDSSKITGAYCKLSAKLPSDVGNTHVSNEIDTRELLHELATDAKQGSMKESLGTIFQKCPLSTCTFSSSSLFGYCMLNNGQFPLYHWIRGLNRFAVMFKRMENVSSLFMLVMCKQLQLSA